MRPWQPDRTIALRCQFAYDVPEPTCDCRDAEVDCECCRPSCDLCENWLPTVECSKPAHVRAQLDDGRYVDCCDERAHGYAQVIWWAPLYSQPVPGGGPGCLAPIESVMKYYYSEQLIGEIADRPHPLVSLIPPLDPGAFWQSAKEGMAKRVTYEAAFTAAGVAAEAAPCDPEQPCALRGGACVVHGGDR